MRPKCILLDIDGTILYHHGTLDKQVKNEPELLSGTLEKLHEWDKEGYRIILITGRKESLRQHTENQLLNLGICFDQLVMGVGGGTRVLINDLKDDGQKTAFAVNIPRNHGISGVDLQNEEF